MRITYSRGARKAAAGAVLACAALLTAACGSAPSSSTASLTGTTTRPAVAATRTATKVFLAVSQDIHRTPLYKPACRSMVSCQLSGDSTAFLYKMTWKSWSATKAVGTGIYELNGCNPYCAAGAFYDVPAVVTLSHPVKACLPTGGTRWFWSRASFRFPKGLPKALQGENAPLNPWTFSGVIAQAKLSCRS